MAKEWEKKPDEKKEGDLGKTGEVGKQGGDVGKHGGDTGGYEMPKPKDKPKIPSA